MVKRAWPVFILAYLLTLLATAPASLLGKYVQYASRGHLLLGNTQGTVWNGSATPALRRQGGGLAALPPLHWKISAASVLTGKLRVRLLWDDQPDAAATLAAISINQVELEHVALTLPARLLEEASEMLRPAMLDGLLRIQSDHLVFSRQGMQGNASVDWDKASSALSSISPLGNYRLLLNGDAGRIGITLTTISGILKLEGNGNWQTASGLEFQGKAQASAEDNDSLAELLNHFGPETSPGTHVFNLAPARQ